jgi:DNA modification methylase
MSELTYRIENKDCMDFLSTVEDNSIDYINVDPPYNIGYDGGDGWDTFESEDVYLQWCDKWIRECYRVLKPEGMFTIWGTMKNDLFLKLKIGVLNNIDGFYSQNPIVWSYNWGGREKTNFPNKFEVTWNYSKGKKFLFNFHDDTIKVDRKMKMNVRTGKPFPEDKMKVLPTSIWEGNLATTSKEAKETKFHPTVKPQFVLQRMISAYSPQGGLVMDIFSGSGSMAVASMETGRSFIGCELHKEYYDKSLERLTIHQPKLF